MSLGPRLVEAGYLELFGRGHEHPLLRDEDALVALALDPSASDRARFLAAEAVLPRHAFATDERAVLADIYASALAEQLTGAGDEWRSPSGSRGHAGENVLSLGPVAVPALARLLDADDAVHYEGSRTATGAELAGYRVKDVAAGLICDVRGEPFSESTDPAVRDAAIERLKGVLG